MVVPVATARAPLITLVLLLVPSLCGLGYLAYKWFRSEEAASLSGHGIVALAVGVVGTIVLAVVLMGLLFYSHRSGQDR